MSSRELPPQGPASGEQGESEASYRPSWLVVGKDQSRATILGDTVETSGLLAGKLDVAVDAQEALEKIAKRKIPYDIVLLTSGRAVKLGMPIGGFLRRLGQLSPTTLPVLITAGELGGITGVPNRKILNALGLRIIYNGSNYPVFINDHEKLFNEVRTASWHRRQQKS